MTAPALPTVGVRLVRVFAVEQTYHMVDAKAGELPKDERNLELIWDWRISDAEQRRIEILLGAEVGPSQASPERAKVALVGTFELADEVKLVGLEKFVRFNAPSILFPYVRESLSALTAKGLFGAHHVPPLNLGKIMQDMATEPTGAVQLREDPDLLRALCGAQELSEQPSKTDAGDEPAPAGRKVGIKE